MIEVALFPIPNAVAFPGTVFPLHVFEPRYRKLVHDSVTDARPIGVCHVIKTLHKPTQPQTLEEALSSNQATYAPRAVFSAGPCEIIDTTSDGRILANIHVEQRLTLVEEIQTLPYRIVTCRALHDQQEEDDGAQDKTLARQIHQRLTELVGEQNPELGQTLGQSDWTSLDPGEYSFKVFQILQFDADTMQSILETQSVTARLQMIWQLLRA